MNATKLQTASASRAPKNDNVHGLSLLAAFLEELIREEKLNHRTQVLLHRVASTVCMLAGGDERMFEDREHPARQIFEIIAQISKLSGDKFVPGDTLYATLIESVSALRGRKLSGIHTLNRVRADLVHVLKLAKMRAPLGVRGSVMKSGDMADAKTIAALLIVRQCNRFDVSDELLYFVLSDWLALMVVIVLKHGRESKALKEADRLTFMLLYLTSSTKGSQQRGKMRVYLPQKLRLLTKSLGAECEGHSLEFASLLSNVNVFINARRKSDFFY